MQVSHNDYEDVCFPELTARIKPKPSKQYRRYSSFIKKLNAAIVYEKVMAARTMTFFYSSILC